jgi:hypothetical protein
MIFLPVLLFGVLLLLLLRTNKIFSFFRRGKGGKEEFQNWPVWGCAQSTFPWTYGQTEQCYILKGKVTVIPDENPEEAVTLEAGDFAEMQKGLSCTWDVLEDVSKNFKFV